jgi:hypothetical protein
VLLEVTEPVPVLLVLVEFATDVPPLLLPPPPLQPRAIKAGMMAAIQSLRILSQPLLFADNNSKRLRGAA